MPLRSIMQFRQTVWGVQEEVEVLINYLVKACVTVRGVELSRGVIKKCGENESVF